MERSLSSQAIDWREGRRFRALELSQLGWKQKDIATALGVTKGAVSQWLKWVREGGIEALRRRKAPGAPPKLTSQQRAQLPELLGRGAQSFGFRGDLWTQPRVTELVRRQFGVSYHPSQVGRILRACGWSRQKPVHRASQRDEAAIQRWRDEEWPRIKKSHSRKADPGVRGPVGFLPAAWGGADLRLRRRLSGPR
jgi:transposase